MLRSHDTAHSGLAATPASSFPVKETIETKPSLSKMFIVEDDRFYASMLRHLASHYGIHMDVFHPDDDFYNLPLDGEYDAAIIDCNLGHLTGAQIAALYSSTPVMLTSAKEGRQFEGPWPRSIKGFCVKHHGFANLIEKTLEMAGLRSEPQSELPPNSENMRKPS